MLNGGRVWMLIGAFVGALVIAFGYFVAASPMLAQADIADQQRRDVESQNAAHEALLGAMRAVDERKPELLERIDELGASVPVVPEVEDYLDELTAYANAAMISLASIRVEAPTLFTPAPDAGPVTFQPGLQERLYLLPVTIELGGDATQVGAFLRSLQSDGRLHLVTKSDVRLGSTLTASVRAYIFVVHDPALGALSAGSVPSTDPEPEAAEETGEEPQPEATPTPPEDS